MVQILLHDLCGLYICSTVIYPVSHAIHLHDDTASMSQVGCRGDDDPAGVVDRSQTLAMEIEVDPQALPRFATIEAVLKGGSLEAPRVVRRSKPVSVTVWPVAARDAGAAGD